MCYCVLNIDFSNFLGDKKNVARDIYIEFGKHVSFNISEDNMHPHKYHLCRHSVQRGVLCSCYNAAAHLSLTLHPPLPSAIQAFTPPSAHHCSTTLHRPNPVLPTNLSCPPDNMCTHPSLYIWWSDLLRGRGCKAPQLIPCTGSGKTLRYCTRLLRYISRNNRLRHLNCVGCVHS